MLGETMLVPVRVNINKLSWHSLVSLTSDPCSSGQAGEATKPALHGRSACLGSAATVPGLKMNPQYCCRLPPLLERKQFHTVPVGVCYFRILLKNGWRTCGGDRGRISLRAKGNEPPSHLIPDKDHWEQQGSETGGICSSKLYPSRSGLVYPKHKSPQCSRRFGYDLSLLLYTEINR